MTTTQKRGQLTDRIRTVADELLGRGMTEPELRLLPYIQYVMVNEQKLDPMKLNAVDRKILRRWKNEGHIEGGISGLTITEEFWDIICELIFLGYVDISE